MKRKFIFGNTVYRKNSTRRLKNRIAPCCPTEIFPERRKCNSLCGNFSLRRDLRYNSAFHQFRSKF